jgi:hypothetical protein
LSSAKGAAPFDLVVNGITYRNINTGQPFTTITPSKETIWSTVPNANSYEDDPVELGVKLKSASDGYVQGIRFYSPQNAAGTYSGHLWSDDGTLLASAIFTNVTSESWQEVLFANPVWIEAGRIYVASYHTSAGRYAASSGGLADEISNGSSLTALANDASKGNGVYRYGAAGFPALSYNATNYWVDVIFTPAGYTFHVTSVTDNNGCSNQLASQVVTVDATACADAETKQAGRSANNMTTSAATISPIKENDVQKGDSMLPGLEQNFPNPFNHQTNIRYSIASPAQTNLSLLDVNGRLMRVLVNSWKNAGTYTLTVDAATLPPGLYFYTLQTGNFSETKKMIIR